ncbi:nucleoside hydrolase [Corynebacterium uropygiale]|uniref:Nucleoside hydrolase n=1 Tax=Corynebacterium uropygiale TaxID=1775911 RepID=A0A9X1U045_9CORY|nr:nucleoside hydrolase [Corynebacterium uropygiale]MCF4006424.1 nucleoside hydrolase [Corynebacterium uropygiale]
MTKIILDLDTGIDDTLALTYALASPELDVIGVTGTYGNVLIETGTRNDLAILELFGHSDVPVFTGEPHASTKDSFEVLDISAFIHGKNGIGEAEIPDPKGSVQEQSAVDFLIDSVNTYGDDLVIVATGPMTNLAAAIAKDPSFAEKARIVIMGGALTVPGNVSPWAEANINQDPDAANALFRSGANVTMIGLDVTLQTLLTVKETAKWRELGTVGGDFLAEATDYYIKAYETTAPHLGGCGLHDPLAVAVAVDPSLVTCLDINMKVDCEGETRGRTIGDEEKLNDPKKSMKVAVGVDVERFLHELMERITRLAADTPARES